MKKALVGLPGVSEVSFDHPSDTFTMVGTLTLDQEQVRAAVMGKVIFPRLRKFVGSLNALAA